MSGKGAQWFVKMYKKICKTDDLVNWWYAQWQLKLNSTVLHERIQQYTIQNELTPIQQITDECDVMLSKIILAGTINDKIKLVEDRIKARECEGCNDKKRKGWMWNSGEKNFRWI